MIKFDSFKEYDAKQALTGKKLEEIDSEQLESDSEEIKDLVEHGVYVIHRFIQLADKQNYIEIFDKLKDDALFAYRVGVAFWEFDKPF